MRVSSKISTVDARAIVKEVLITGLLPYEEVRTRANKLCVERGLDHISSKIYASLIRAYDKTSQLEKVEIREYDPHKSVFAVYDIKYKEPPEPIKHYGRL